MIAKVKSPTFIDSVKIELNDCCTRPLRVALRDDKGSICCQLETEVQKDELEFIWKGLNDLPYGVYTLELTQGEEEMRLRMVKRV